MHKDSSLVSQNCIFGVITFHHLPNIISSVKHGGGGIMMWSCLSEAGTGVFSKIKKDQKSQQCCMDLALVRGRTHGHISQVETLKEPKVYQQDFIFYVTFLLHSVKDT